MRTILVLSTIVSAAAACGGPAVTCELMSCPSGGVSYRVCSDSTGYTTYTFGGAECDCDGTTASCNACASQVANYCAPVVTGPGGPPTCMPPAASTFTPTTVYDIAPNAGFAVPPSESNPWFGITSNGQGSYHLEWSDPTGAPTCFTGLVTINSAFIGNPTADNGSNVVLNDPGQLSFAGMPGSSTGAIDFNAGNNVVALEAYTDVNAPIDVYYTDNTTSQVMITGSNVVGFQSP